MVVRMLFAVLVLWLLLTFTPQILVWGTEVVRLTTDHVEITLK